MGATHKGTRCPLCQGGFEEKKPKKPKKTQPKAEKPETPQTLGYWLKIKNPSITIQVQPPGLPSPSRGKDSPPSRTPALLPRFLRGPAARAAPSGRGRAESPPGSGRAGRHLPAAAGPSAASPAARVAAPAAGLPRQCRALPPLSLSPPPQASRPPRLLPMARGPRRVRSGTAPPAPRAAAAAAITALPLTPGGCGRPGK